MKIHRRELELPSTRVVHRGKGYQSSVYLVEIDGKKVAVKDFVKTPFFFHFVVAPWLVTREVKALSHLDGTPGVPRFYGRVDRYAFALEFIEGKPIADFLPGTLPTSVLPRVQQCINAIHQKGVAHGDLKRRSNVLVTSNEQVYLIDFAASLIRRPFNPLMNRLQKAMAEIDDKSIYKMKKFAAPDSMTREDWEKLNTLTPLEKWARRILKR